jgi:hypothetical protein
VNTFAQAETKCQVRHMDLKKEVIGFCSAWGKQNVCIWEGNVALLIYKYSKCINFRANISHLLQIDTDNKRANEGENPVFPVSCASFVRHIRHCRSLALLARPVKRQHNSPHVFRSTMRPLSAHFVFEWAKVNSFIPSNPYR